MSRSRVDCAGLALVAASVTLGAAGQVLMKLGTHGLHTADLLTVLQMAFGRVEVLAGLATYGISALIWLVVLSRMELATVYPLGAASYVLVVVASRLTGEHVGVQRWLGLVAITVGVVLVASGARTAGDRG